MFPKSPRVVDEKHRKVVRSLGCLICVKRGDAHHLNQGGFGSDYSIVPLCRRHHTEAHMGKRKFESKYDIDLWKEAWRIIIDMQGLGDEATGYRDCLSDLTGSTES